MTEAREIFCKEMNDLFGTDISVKLREEVLDNVESGAETRVDTEPET